MLFYLLRSGNLSNLRSTLSASTRRTCRKWYVRFSSAIKFHLQLLFRFNSSDTSSYIVFLNSPSTHKRNILQKAMKPSIKMSRTSRKLSSRCKYKFQFSSFEINKTGKVLLIKTEHKEKHKFVIPQHYMQMHLNFQVFESFIDLKVLEEEKVTVDVAALRFCIWCFCQAAERKTNFFLIFRKLQFYTFSWLSLTVKALESNELVRIFLCKNLLVYKI